MPIVITETAAQSHAELQALLVQIVAAINSVTGGETGLSATAYADLVAAKVSLDTIKTALDELIDDHATFRISTDELIDDHATFKTLADATKTLVNDIRTQLLADTVDGGTGLAIGSSKDSVANSEFTYRINGAVYTKAADSVGVLLSGATVPLSKAGGWALDIDSAGTITIIPATDNGTGYASEVLAKAGIPAIVVADTVRLGTVTVLNTAGGAFIPGTTLLDAVTVSSKTFTNAVPALVGLGAAISVSSPTTLSAGKVPTLTAPKNTAMAAITTIGS